MEKLGLSDNANFIQQLVSTMSNDDNHQTGNTLRQSSSSNYGGIESSFVELQHFPSENMGMNMLSPFTQYSMNSSTDYQTMTQQRNNPSNNNVSNLNNSSLMSDHYHEDPNNVYMSTPLQNQIANQNQLKQSNNNNNLNISNNINNLNNSNISNQTNLHTNSPVNNALLSSNGVSKEKKRKGEQVEIKRHRYEIVRSFFKIYFKLDPDSMVPRESIFQLYQRKVPMEHHIAKNALYRLLWTVFHKDTIHVSQVNYKEFIKGLQGITSLNDVPLILQQNITPYELSIFSRTGTLVDLFDFDKDIFSAHHHPHNKDHHYDSDSGHHSAKHSRENSAEFSLIVTKDGEDEYMTTYDNNGMTRSNSNSSLSSMSISPSNTHSNLHALLSPNDPESLILEIESLEDLAKSLLHELKELKSDIKKDIKAKKTKLKK